MCFGVNESYGKKITDVWKKIFEKNLGIFLMGINKIKNNVFFENFGKVFHLDGAYIYLHLFWTPINKLTVKCKI